jgi:hypothetical protein
VPAITIDSLTPDDEKEKDDSDLDFAKAGQSRQWVPYGLEYDIDGNGGFFLRRVKERHLFEEGSYMVGRGRLSMA